MPDGSNAVVRPARTVRGVVRIPGDKSISHRYAMLAAIAEGTSRFQNFSAARDCASTLDCVASSAASGSASNTKTKTAPERLRCMAWGRG